MTSVFNKTLTPDSTLAAVIGSDPVSRPQTIKKVWDYIKANNLQVPENKRHIRADDKLRAVWGKDEINMTEISKLTFPHLS